LLLVLGILAGIGWWWWGRTHVEVWALNPFDEALDVTVTGQTLHLAPHARVAVRLAAGPATLEAKLGNRLVESQRVDVPAGVDAAIYNPLGAGPLFRVDVRYSSTASTGRSAAPAVFISGTSWTVINSADYVFVKPPSSISVSSGSGDQHRVLITDGGGKSWRSTLGYLIEHDGAEKARALATAIAPFAPEAVSWGIEAARRTGGLDAAIAFERQQLQDRDDYVLHRTYQHDRRARDGIMSVREEYRAKAAQSPPPFARLLLARVDDRVSAEQALRELMRDKELGSTARRVLAWKLTREERWPEVESLLASDSDGVYLDLRLQALVAQGKKQQALELARGAVGDSEVSPSVLVRAARQVSTQAAEDLLTQLVRARRDAFDEPGEAVVVRVLAGLIEPAALPKSDSPGMVAAQMIGLAAKDPAAAWKKVAHASKKEVDGIDPHVAFLLGTEYHRVGDDQTATALLLHAQKVVPIPIQAAWRFVETGTETEDVRAIDNESRAALLVVRARQVEAAGGHATSLRDLAIRLTPLGGPISQSALSWPRGQPEAPDAALDAPVVFVRTPAVSRVVAAQR